MCPGRGRAVRDLWMGRVMGACEVCDAPGPTSERDSAAGPVQVCAKCEAENDPFHNRTRGAVSPRTKSGSATTQEDAPTGEETQEVTGRLWCPSCGVDGLVVVGPDDETWWRLGCVECGWESEVVTDAFTGAEEVLARYEEGNER